MPCQEFWVPDFFNFCPGAEMVKFNVSQVGFSVWADGTASLRHPTLNFFLAYIKPLRKWVLFPPTKNTWIHFLATRGQRLAWGRFAPRTLRFSARRRGRLARWSLFCVTNPIFYSQRMAVARGSHQRARQRCIMIPDGNKTEHKNLFLGWRSSWPYIDNVEWQIFKRMSKLRRHDFYETDLVFILVGSRHSFEKSDIFFSFTLQTKRPRHSNEIEEKLKKNLWGK